MSFRVNCKNFFLTWPQCSLHKEEVLYQLQNINPPENNQIKFIRVCEEKHEDGSPHLHALFQFKERYNCENSRFFDLRHPSNSQSFHCHIEAAKSAKAVKDYVAKDRCIIDWGEFQPDQRSVRGSQREINQCYAEALNSGNKIQALDVVRDKLPRDFVIYFPQLSKNFDSIFNPPPPPSDYKSPFPLSSFNNVPEELQRWADDYFSLDAAARPLRPKSIVIEGDSRTGKTVWARALGKHNYLADYFEINRDNWSNDSLYNVIDDVEPKHLKHWKNLFGAQSDWQVNPKYEKVYPLKGGLPTIFLCNPGRYSSYKYYLDLEGIEDIKSWTYKNAIFIILTEPLFKESSISENNPQEGQETQVREPIPLIIHHLPIAVTFAFFGDETTVVIDPTHSEEAVMGGRMVATLNTNGDVCAIKKAGGVGVLHSVITQCLRIASVKAADITSKIKTAVESYSTERALRKIKRHPPSASLGVNEPGVKREIQKQSNDGRGGGSDLSGQNERLMSATEETGASQSNSMEEDRQSSEQDRKDKRNAHKSRFIGGPSSWDPYSKGIDADALKISLASRGVPTANHNIEKPDEKKPTEAEENQPLVVDSKPRNPPDEAAPGKKTLKDAVKPKNKRKKKTPI